MFNIVYHLKTVVKKNALRQNSACLKIRAVMVAKDERIGFRVGREIKKALLQIASKEGRSLAQTCELMLRAGIHGYEKEGSKYLQRYLTAPDQPK